MGQQGPLALAPTFLPSKALATQQGSLTRGREDSLEQIETGSIVGGRYEIAEFVAKGAFGAVYRAHDLDVAGHVVALKLMHRPAASASEYERCLREVQLIAAVSHPSVVSFKDHGLHRGRFYIVMPWYDGETLAKRLESRGALSRRRALSIFSRLSEALAAMHERGIRHQDVKPENIYLARFGAGQEDFPVLLDLGVGAFANEHLPAFTAAYVAPEMAHAHLELGVEEARGAVDGKADVFALALTLFDALAPGAREVCPNASSPDALKRRAERGAELPKLAALSDVAAGFARWLSVDPKERPSARELVSELRLLTRVEDRRAERRRMALRAGPPLALVLIVMGVLAVQLRKERVSSRVKDARIEQQAAEIDQAREAIDALAEERQTHEREATEARNENALLEAKLARETARKLSLERALDSEQRTNRDLKRGVADNHERMLVLEHELRLLDQQVAQLESERNGATDELKRAHASRRTLSAAYDEARSQAERLAEELREQSAARDEMIARIAELERVESALVAEVNRLRAQAEEKPRKEALLQSVRGSQRGGPLM